MNTSDDIIFRTINENVIKRLERTKRIRLPRRRVSVPRDKKWNEQQMKAKILQGILSGSSIPDIATSMLRVVHNNEVSAIRNARTMVTSAENHGRLDSYKELDKKGVVQKKTWIATPDDRVRESHLDMDGEEVDIDEEFSNKCQFPGDASCGDPSEVWNCRCSMKARIVGFRRDDGSISYVQGDRGTTLHDRQIAEERDRREEDG